MHILSINQFISFKGISWTWHFFRSVLDFVCFFFLTQNMKRNRIYSINSVSSQNEDSNTRKVLQRNFIRSLSPIYYFSRAFGLMPFSIVHNANGDFQAIEVKKIDFLWFTVSISLYMIMAFICFHVKRFLVDEDSSYILMIGDRLLLTVALLCSAVSTIYA